jgi:pSer/pThr/pTyr-binding forkhead associated (FHA) protein
MADANPDNPTAYLIRDNTVVHELPPHSVLNIGRLDTNDIVLDDFKVSREHALLKYTDGKFTLIDLASTHGTFVDGEGIERATLKPGAKIQIVNHELLLADKIPESLRHATVVTPRAARALDRRLKFFGGLNEISLLTLVQFLSQEKQDGLLLLEIGAEPGPKLFFQQGDITHVTGSHELAELMTRQYHDPSLFFYFHNEIRFPERTIHVSTAQFLMELCHHRDQQAMREVDAAAAERQARKQAPTGRLPEPLEPVATKPGSQA